MFPYVLRIFFAKTSRKSTNFIEHFVKASNIYLAHKYYFAISPAIYHRPTTIPSTTTAASPPPPSLQAPTHNPLFIPNTLSLTGIIHTVHLPPALNYLPPSDMGKGTKKCSEGGIKILTE
ncbi:MAG: hypothetical protein ACRC3G_05250 [Bacteroidales bacterium]